jgi:hypothetical protein
MGHADRNGAIVWYLHTQFYFAKFVFGRYLPTLISIIFVYRVQQ